MRPATGADRKPRTELERRRDRLIEANRRGWAERHPAAAAEERALRIANIAARERWKHKRNGTVQTHDHASRAKQGALARLYQSGAIDGPLLDAGVAISHAALLIMRDVDIRAADLSTRVDRSPSGDVFWESLGRVWLEAAYSAWRSALGARARIVLAVVCEDLGIAAAAARQHMSVRRARAELVTGLERWIELHAQARREIDDEVLAQAQAALS